MKCPFCNSLDNKVLDSRLSKDQSAIRRRRECLKCNERFTTYEQIEKTPVMVIKKDGRREEFLKNKIRNGMIKACEKRNISIDIIDEFVKKLEQDLEELGKKEIPAKIIGEKIMTKLKEIDDVAYVRFASVYKEFKSIEDFMSELKKL